MGRVELEGSGELGALSTRERERLFEFLRIPSVSGREAFTEDVREAARWTVEEAREIGLETTLLETSGHPVVLAEYAGAGDRRPTLLIYAHYDVQPAGPDAAWETPPFEPTVRRNRLWGRGTADDKSQLFVQLTALRRALEQGDLPVNVRLVADGEEEVGSRGLLELLAARPERFAADYFIIADSALVAAETPSMTVSLRGMAGFALEVRGPRQELHSGHFGGAVVDPAVELAGILSSMLDDDRRVALPGFYEDVRPWPSASGVDLAAVPLDEDEIRETAGRGVFVGESGRSFRERIWTRPSFDVHSMSAGEFDGELKTAIPPVARATFSMRLVPDQDPAEVEASVRARVREVAVEQAEVRLKTLHLSRPWRTSGGGGFQRRLSRALAAAYGEEPILKPHGGTLPVAAELSGIARHGGVVLGFAWPGANMHAPNEWFPVESFDKGLATMKKFYELCAGLEPTGRLP